MAQSNAGLKFTFLSKWTVLILTIVTVGLVLLFTSMFSATTRKRVRFWPVCLSSHVSICSRPSTKTGLPFFKYSLATSAVRPQRVTSTNVTSSRFSPLSVV